ncbi:MAG: hypothetical protein QOH46_4165, partial [Solirubrobacteraceae bacterium]|nr:hypothetical protein [Solirubrobacteraceae bacterium]
MNLLLTLAGRARTPLSLRTTKAATSALVVLFALAAAPAVTSASSTTWQAPTRLGGDLDQSLQVSAANEDGAAVAIWEDYAEQGIFASYRSASGAWGGPELAEPGGVQTGHKAVAIDAQGAVTLVYRTCETCGIRARRRAVDGTWSEPAELEDFDPLGESQGNLYARPTSPDVAVAPDGRATAVWSIGGQGTRQEVIRTSTYENGAWSPAELLSGGLHAEGDDRVYEHRSVPQVAFDASGRTLVAWTRAFEDIDDRSDWQRNMVYIETGSRAADADAFAPGAEVTRRTATETPSDMRMAVSDAGVATFVWAALATTGAELRARRRSAAGVMGDVGIVNGGATEGQHDHQMPAVAVTPGGDATIVWTHVTQNF